MCNISGLKIRKFGKCVSKKGTGDTHKKYQKFSFKVPKYYSHLCKHVNLYISAVDSGDAGGARSRPLEFRGSENRIEREIDNLLQGFL